MGHRLSTSVCAAAMLLVTSACCQKTEQSTPDSQNLPANRSGASPGAPKQKSKPLSPDKIGAMTKQIAAGHTVHPKHSFELNLNGFEGSMLATTGPNQSTFVFHFFDASGKRVTSVFDKDMDAVQGTVLLAVAFEDVDRDGREDLVVLATYLAAKSDYNAVSVYTRPGGGPFRFKEKLGEKAGNVPSMAAALAKLR